VIRTGQCPEEPWDRRIRCERVWERYEVGECVRPCYLGLKIVGIGVSEEGRKKRYIV